MKLNWDSDYLNGGQNNEFNIHGETWLWDQLKHKPPTIAFDVGCNVGEWTKMVRRNCPETEIHAFEIIGSTFQKYYHNVKYDTMVFPNGYGLSDKEEIIPIKYAKYNDRISTGLSNLRIDNHESILGFARTGDIYVSENKITHIDYLKIDVEGIGHKVIKGFKNTLLENKISVIQFEYDRTCILERFLLIDYYEILQPLGFIIGKLRPGGVEFKEYSLFDENFDGPDVIACHRSQTDLISLLSCK